MDPKPSEITAESVYQQRRAFLKEAVALGLVGSVSAGLGLSGLGTEDAEAAELADLKAQKTAYGAGLTVNKIEDITGYNNFYEFGLDKTDPKANATSLKPKPWSVVVGGECEVKGRFDLTDLMKGLSLEERIYRLRCVEAWSMVIPWVGVPLKSVLTQFKPTSRAKFVKFTTLLDPKQMPGQNRAVLDWPYVEGLRIDEAMHPLTLLAVGLYGKELPNQNGAPLRLVVPWKYGFKSIKSIVKIDFVEKAPTSSWMSASPSEYGFFANVNPEVSHPRWSQASERRIGSGLFAARVPTLPFNGYADEVASLYQGMDLRKYF